MCVCVCFLRIYISSRLISVFFSFTKRTERFPSFFYVLQCLKRIGIIIFFLKFPGIPLGNQRHISYLYSCNRPQRGSYFVGFCVVKFKNKVVEIIGFLKNFFYEKNAKKSLREFFLTHQGD